MLTEQRKQKILALLKRDGRIVAKELAELFTISEDTIRRDLRELAKLGLLQRVHGGALPSSPAVADFVTRTEISHQQKIHIGRTAAQLIKSGQVVMIDGGTTAVQLVRHLPKDLSATIVTHSPSVAVELIDHENIAVELIGGRLFKHSMVSMGARALESLAHIHADVFFMGVTGIHPDHGFTTGDLEEAYMKKALSRHAAETVVMASDEKIGVASSYLVLPTAEISSVIIDMQYPKQDVQWLADAGVNLIFSG